MEIHGLNKTTLLDFPGRVAATIFTGGCNFRCPFCHNKGLVLHPEAEPTVSEEEVWDLLKKRKTMLQGICITGGEPTLQPDLVDWVRKAKMLGYQIKLDTNGYRPQVLRELLEEGLLDYVAMDVKSSRENYGVLAGRQNMDLTPIEESMALLRASDISYEYRTTVIRELHTRGDFVDIGKWLAGAPAYYLQAYREDENVLQPGFHAYEKEAMLEFAAILKVSIPVVEVRGMD